MRLEVRDSASRSIAKTGNWVEKKNTEGSGERWIRKVYETLEEQTKLGVKYNLCRNENFARRGYRCFVYNDEWIVAYKINGDSFIVHKFVWGGYLV